MKAELQFVFVHGLSGWGSYDDLYRKMPYWGMRGGDLTAFLRGRDFYLELLQLIRKTEG